MLDALLECNFTMKSKTFSTHSPMLSTVTVHMMKLFQLVLLGLLMAHEHTSSSSHRLRWWLASGRCCQLCCWFCLWLNLWTAPRKMRSWRTQMNSLRARPVTEETLHLCLSDTACPSELWLLQFFFLFLTQVTENYIRNLSDTTLSHTPTTCKCYDLSCFSLLTCSSSKITFFVFAFAASLTTVSPTFGLAPRCPGNQVMLENSTDCGCPFGLVMSGDKCSCPVGFTLENAAGCKGGWGQDQCFKEFSKNTQFKTVAVADYHLSLIHSYFIVKLSISIITPQMAHWQ